MDPIIEEPFLIERAAQGDTEAFSKLFHRYHAMIHAFVYRLCFDPAEAQDIAQETFINAARALGNGAAAQLGVADFRPWLYRIALNVARDGQRRRRRRAAMAEEMALRQRGDEQVRPAQFGELETALAALPDDLRQALVLVFYEELSHAQAAAALGCAETTISWRVFRAKRRLRKTLLPKPTLPTRSHP